jgi:hypothetical protein
MTAIKKLGEKTEVTSLSDGQKIPLVDANNIVTRISPENLKSSFLSGMSLNLMEDGVFIMYHRSSDNYPLMVKPHKWPSLQTSGEIADGVAIAEGGHVVVVAPTEATSLKWSSAAITGGGTSTADRATAIADWNGKASTAAQIAASISSAVTNTASYAPGWCNLYSRANKNGYGLTAGKWWLPSVGEMMMIYANMTKVNYALSLIAGSAQLSEDWYWTSTENGSSIAWYLSLTDGTLNYWYAKATSSLHVRAVSAFIG